MRDGILRAGGKRCFAWPVWKGGRRPTNLRREAPRPTYRCVRYSASIVLARPTGRGGILPVRSVSRGSHPVHEHALSGCPKPELLLVLQRTCEFLHPQRLGVIGRSQVIATKLGFKLHPGFSM